MSYILDALKKAESDRKLGSVPNIHTHAVTTADADRAASRWATRWMWAALALLVSAVLAIIWRQPWQTAPVALSSAALPRPSAPKIAEPALPQPSVPAVTAPASPPIAVTTPIAAASLQSSLPTETKPTPPTAVAALVAAPSAAKSVQPKFGPAIAAKSNDKPAENQPSQPIVAAVAPRNKSIARPPEPGREMPAPAEPRVPNLRELPQNIQAEIPPLAVTGYIYSKNEADRSVLINNKLLREGDQAAPGVVLEKMTSKEAILNYKGYRYRLSY